MESPPAGLLSPLPGPFWWSERLLVAARSQGDVSALECYGRLMKVTIRYCNA